MNDVPPAPDVFADWYLCGQLFADPADLLRDLLAAYRRLEKSAGDMKEALRRACDETDYCSVCDRHPASSGHAPDCPLWETY